MVVLSGLVAAVREAGVDVLSLRPDVSAAEVLGETVEAVDRRGAEEQRVERETLEVHWDPQS